LARAKDSKVDPKKLPPIDSLIKGKEPSEAEAKAFFESNKAKLPPGGTFEQFKPDIVRHLTQQSTQSAFKAKLEELEKQGKLKIIALAPEAPVVNFDLSKYPAKGPQDAPVTLVEASDYLCPHCQQEQPAVEAVLKEFAGKIRFVQVNFALRPDGLSGELARGAHCARKQGDEAFWKFHSKAFEMRFEQSPTPDRGKVLDVAKGAGLDAKILEQCLATAEPKAAVEQAVAAMSDVGVHGTPTFFLNGRKLHTDHVSLKDAVRAALDAKGQTH
jgi:protein-disulfide isomerase